MATEPLAMQRLALEPGQWEELLAILRSHLCGHAVWAFGSRATGRNVKRFSDLDLAVDGELPLATLAALRLALEESRLPFKVDIVEISALTAEFRARIESEFVAIPLPR